jgi:polysaccharide export outer membrane protein
MTKNMQGVFRPLARVSSWALVFVVLTAPAAFPQKQKTPAPQSPTSQAVIQANERLAQLAGAAPAKQSDYVIGSGDVLGIDVFDVPELSREVRVNETGYISLPLLPVKVQVAGLTSFQLQDKIAELLQSNGLVSAPQVTISIKEQRSQPITIIGAVKNPMIIQAVRQTTLVQALSQAGGIADDAGNTVIVTRSAPSLPASEDSTSAPDAAADPEDPKTFVITISDLLESGDSRFNISILGGDVISVPRAGIIYVVGAVNHPGGFVIQNDRDRMTALKMLSLAGGATSTAKVKGAVILRKNLDTGKRDEVPLDLNKVMNLKGDDVTLQASDILYVPDSNGKKALHRAGDVAIALTTGVALVTATRY